MKVLSSILGFLICFVLNHVLTFFVLIIDSFCGFYVRRPNNWFCLVLHILYSIVLTPVMLLFVVVSEAAILAFSPIAVIVMLIFGSDKSFYGTLGISMMLLFAKKVFELLLIIPDKYSEKIFGDVAMMLMLLRSMYCVPDIDDGE